MSLGLVGRKLGMTRIFTDDGSAVPVTVLDVANNRVTQIKTPETDGYSAVQVTFGKRRASRVTKPQAGPSRQSGRRSRASAEGISGRRRSSSPSSRSAATIGVDDFAVGQMVDVTGTTKGRGFSGVIRRHTSARTARRTAIRARTTRRARSAWRRIRAACFRASAWPASYGNVKRTTQTLKVVRVDAERGLLLVKGAVPGADGGHIVVRPAAKRPRRRGPDMDLKLINDQGEPAATRRRVRTRSSAANTTKR